MTRTVSVPIDFGLTPVTRTKKHSDVSDVEATSSDESRTSFSLDGVFKQGGSFLASSLPRERNHCC